MLKQMLLWKNFIRPTGKSTFKLYDPLGIKLLTRLQLRFYHLSEHKFRQNFADLENSLESTLHIFYAAKIILHYAELL